MSGTGAVAGRRRASLRTVMSAAGWGVVTMTAPSMPLLRMAPTTVRCSSDVPGGVSGRQISADRTRRRWGKHTRSGFCRMTARGGKRRTDNQVVQTAPECVLTEAPYQRCVQLGPHMSALSNLSCADRATSRERPHQGGGSQCSLLRCRRALSGAESSRRESSPRQSRSPSAWWGWRGRIGRDQGVPPVIASDRQQTAAHLAALSREGQRKLRGDSRLADATLSSEHENLASDRVHPHVQVALVWRA